MKFSVCATSVVALRRVAFAVCLLSLLFVDAWGGPRKDSISVSGAVTDFFTNERLSKGLFTVYDTTGVIIACDSIIDTHDQNYGTWKYTVPAHFNFKLPHGGNYKIRFDVEGYVSEMQDFSVPDRKFHKYVTQWSLSFKIRKKPREHVLGEAVVKATRIKMVVKGDTVEYDADAFNMAEGSMLDKLLAEMPGMEIKDNGEIFHNGKKVESLLVDGKDFFDGDPKLALENLPAYTVKKVQVYRKDDNAAYLIKDSVKREEMKKLVVDVKLKKQYKRGWIFNSDVAYGTSDRYSTKFTTLYFNDRWKFMSYVDCNNVNKYLVAGGNDGNIYINQLNDGLQHDKRVGVRASYDKSTPGKYEGLKFTIGGQAQHNDKLKETQTTSTTYLVSGDTYTRSKQRERTSSTSFSWYDNVQLMRERVYAYANLFNGTYKRYRTTGNSRRVSFDSDPNDAYRLASLDSIFMPMGSVRLEQMRLNSVLDKTQSENVSKNYHSNGQLNMPDPFFGNNMMLWYNIDYTDNRVENYQHYLLNNRLLSSQDFRNVYFLSPSKSLKIKTSVSYGVELVRKKLWFDFRQWLACNRDKNAPERYRLDSLGGWNRPDDRLLGALPSTRDSMMMALDIYNSYNRTTTSTESNSISSLNWQLNNGWNVKFEIPVYFESGRITDTRSANRQTGRANVSTFSPNLYINRYFTKDGIVKNFHVTYRYYKSLPTLSYLLDITDDTNPLFVSKGNASLKGSSKNYLDVRGTYSNSKHMQNFNASLYWEQTSNAVAMATIYDRATGVTTYKPLNVGGNWMSKASMFFERCVDKKDRFSFREEFDFRYNHSVDLVSDNNGETTKLLRSTVHNYNVRGNTSLKYSINKRSFVLGANVNWKRQFGNRDNFSSLSAADINYYLRANGPLVWDIDVTSIFNIYSRRGYASSAMNDDHFVWNLTLSRPFLKSKALIFKLEVCDLLADVSDTRTVVNAQGFTETWYNSIPHYAMLHVCYKFNTMSKKKNSDK
ncbi:MAG: outer membrane beta-barrel protein [Bacteroidaceae bacterium]|nr:outer membrane beta-barrel protein [Bacteroidaceae bacterium]